MSLEDLREKLSVALADPRRRQLAHIAILEVAMAAAHALEAGGLASPEVEEATETISAYLKGERPDLPAGAVPDLVNNALATLSQNAAFAALFR